MTKIPQEHGFLSLENFPLRKVKQFVSKHYITWLIGLANKLWCKKITDFFLGPGVDLSSCGAVVKFILLQSC